VNQSGGILEKEPLALYDKDVAMSRRFRQISPGRGSEDGVGSEDILYSKHDLQALEMIFQPVVIPVQMGGLDGLPFTLSADFFSRMPETEF
jgi:hypothetical protein